MRATLGPLLLMGCASAAALPAASPEGAFDVMTDAGLEQPASVRGRVRFETRAPTPTGASAAKELLAANGIVVRALDAAGREVGLATTDASGGFRLDAGVGATLLELRAELAERAGGHARLAVTRDAMGERVHALRVPLAEVIDTGDIVARDDESPLAGALHILDAMRRGVVAVQEWTGDRLPAFFAYWDRGVTTTWSFYSGERPAGSGRYTIELLGGEPGRRAVTDTDEHDESIVLHELGHFVMDVLTSDSSTGGSHPRGVLIDPGLAWEEGRATWFAAAVQGRPRYLDTIGLEPSGELRVAHDLERGRGDEPKGLGSEAAVAEVLWDLSDGAAGLRDDDFDGVALGPAAVLDAMRELSREEGVFPALPTFLQFLTRTGRVEPSALANLLARSGQPRQLLPGPGEAPPWPVDLTNPGEARGRIDGLTDPAPSGGPARPSNGLDALAVFRFQVDAEGRFRVRLRITGSGGDADRTDLDLELRDQRAELVAASRGTGSEELISRQLAAGTYVVYVRDGGNGNRADFVLEVGPDAW